MKAVLLTAIFLAAMMFTAEDFPAEIPETQVLHTPVSLRREEDQYPISGSVRPQNRCLNKRPVLGKVAVRA